MYKGKQYSNCTDEDAAQMWCPSAVTKDKTSIERSWRFCNSSLETCEETTCKSRETLELLIDNFLDLSKTNPSLIAKELFNVGCPFFCHYRDYEAELMLKKLDDTLQTDHLHLLFELPGESGSKENIKKNLDYSLDMFISDLGNGFGFLLGLSLIGVIGIFIQSVGLFGRSIVSTSLRNVPFAKMVYDILKWTLVAGFVSYLAISSLVRDFSDLLNFQSVSSSDSKPTRSRFLNPDLEETDLSWGFRSNLEGDSLCPYDSEVADGFCDDKANTNVCRFDGGDCCRPGVERKPNSHWFCSNCTCHSGKVHRNALLKPGEALSQNLDYEYIHRDCSF